MDELKGDGTNILFSQTVPPYQNSSLQVSQEYLNLLKFYYPQSEPTYASFESFLAAKLVVKALENVNGPLTHQNFLQKLKTLPSDILGNIPIKYTNSQLLNKAYLSIYENGNFKPAHEID
jgi:ABC-type branched-subunit amino acid transport system substrate-binding protein